MIFLLHSRYNTASMLQLIGFLDISRHSSVVFRLLSGISVVRRMPQLSLGVGFPLIVVRHRYCQQSVILHCRHRHGLFKCQSIAFSQSLDVSRWLFVMKSRRQPLSASHLSAVIKYYLSTVSDGRQPSMFNLTVDMLPLYST